MGISVFRLEVSLEARETHQILESMAPVYRASNAQPAARLSSMGCALSILIADLLATGVSVAVVTIGLDLLERKRDLARIDGGGSVFHAVAILYVVIIAYLAIKGRYSERTPFWTEMKFIFCASLYAVFTEILIAVLSLDIRACIPAVSMMLLFPVLASFGNNITKYFLTKAGAWTLSVVLVGAGDSAIAAEAALASDPGLGYEIAGRVDPHGLVAGQVGLSLWPLVQRFRADYVLFVLDGDRELQRQLIDCALRQRVPFIIAPEPHNFPAFAWEATRFFSHDVVMLAFPRGVSRYVSQMLKAIIDISAAVILLILTSPIFLIVAILNYRDGGPIFFAHRRLGIGGTSFYCLKFRTMVVDGDRVLKDALMRDPSLAQEWALSQKLRNDPRVTPVGRFLRQTSLDELPQLINVLRRQMSLVGPRPIVESEVRFYGDDIAHYFYARPGVTGLWQVSGRSNTSYARRVQLDVWYMNNWTVWLDIAVLLKTLPAVLGRIGAH